jgi:hypothetical protein
MIAASLAACSSDSHTPEQRVRAVIEAMEIAVESGSVKQTSALLAETYSDGWHPNKRAAIGSLFAYLRRHRSVHLFVLIKSIELGAEANTANAVAYVAMTGVPVRSVETLFSLKADLYRFDVRLSSVDGEWRVSGSRWERASLTVLE